MGHFSLIEHNVLNFRCRNLTDNETWVWYSTRTERDVWWELLTWAWIKVAFTPSIRRQAMWKVDFLCAFCRKVYGDTSTHLRACYLFYLQAHQHRNNLYSFILPCKWHILGLKVWLAQELEPPLLTYPVVGLGDIYICPLSTFHEQVWPQLTANIVLISCIEEITDTIQSYNGRKGEWDQSNKAQNNSYKIRELQNWCGQLFEHSKKIK